MKKELKNDDTNAQVHQNKVANAKMKIVYRVPNHELLDKLERSLVGETICPVDFKQLSEEIMKVVVSSIEVCKLGAYKALIVFESKQKIEEYLFKNNESLNKFFEEVKP